MQSSNLGDIEKKIKSFVMNLPNIDAKYIEPREISRKLSLSEDVVQACLDKLVEEKVFDRFFTIKCPYCYDETITTKDLNKNLSCEECGEEIESVEIWTMISNVYYSRHRKEYEIKHFDISKYILESIPKDNVEKEQRDKKVIEILDFKHSFKKEDKDMKKKIFISHSEQDKDIVREIVELLGDIGVPVKKEHIFCSSYEGLGVSVGMSISKYIKNEFKEEMIALCIFSENYYASANCLCELGAIWVKSKECIPVVINGFDFSEIKGFVDDNKGINIEEDKCLNEFKERIVEIFELEQVNNWENIRGRFKRLTKRD